MNKCSKYKRLERQTIDFPQRSITSVIFQIIDYPYNKNCETDDSISQHNIPSARAEGSRFKGQNYTIFSYLPIILDNFQVQRFKGSKVQNAKFIIDGMFKMYLYYIYIIIYI